MFSITNRKMQFKTTVRGSSLVVQWLRICLPLQGTQVQYLIQEDSTCCGAIKLLCYSY